MNKIEILYKKILIYACRRNSVNIHKDTICFIVDNKVNGRKILNGKNIIYKYENLRHEKRKKEDKILIINQRGECYENKIKYIYVSFSYDVKFSTNYIFLVKDEKDFKLVPSLRE